MIDVSVKGLVKSFDSEQNILEGLTFDVQSGERVGIVGNNGAGKTTLFRLLCGELQPDDGTVSFASGKKIGLISQIPRFPVGTTVEQVLGEAYREADRVKAQMDALAEKLTQSAPNTLLRQYDELENRFRLLGGYERSVETDKVANGLALDKAMRARLFDTLSGGEKTRVNLARLLLEKTDILLLDEPTNHLDLHSVEWLEEYLSSFRGTVLTVSHDRYFLDRVVSRIIEIRGGKAEFYSGNYSFYVTERQARYDLQLKQYEKEQAKLAQLGFTLERMKGWGINNRTLYRRAMSIQHRMDRIEQTERPQKDKTLRASFSQKEFLGDELFSVKRLTKSYGEKTLFSDVELHVKGGERIALLGDNGTGKTTFLRVLCGLEKADGVVSFAPTAKTAYLEQNIHFKDPTRTLLDTMLYEKKCSVQTARDRLGLFLFSGEDVFKRVDQLSGGEMSRLRLCMLMDDKVNLLILDEPTNHLDIASRDWLEDAVDDYDGTLLFVSHDRYFIRRFATRIWELADGTIRDYPFGYEKYRAVKAHEPPKPAAAPKEKHPRAQKNDKELDKTIRRLEREIEKQEQTVAELEQQISAAATDYLELTRLSEEKNAADAALERLLNEWEACSLEKEGKTE
ncbi:MAG: ABC-F family ATP-binding cassette domain-containing protein [Oscillospiraceae bacterium]|nr:ABC-F family ATP-binding cassette domain-containing protein [Oscillospiraceae bacterium]